MKLIIVKQLNNSFKPAYDSDYEKIKKLKVGELLECSIKMPRNSGFHRKFFALINLVFQNQEVYKNIDHLRRDLIVATGYYEEWADWNGEIKIRAKSISFSSMQEDEFKKLYDAVLDKITEIYGYSKKDIIENLQDFY